VAAWLRFWRLSWGLPEQAGFPDEGWIFNRYAEAFTSLSWASFAQRVTQYPTLYGYLVGLTALALRGVGFVEGTLAPLTPGAFVASRSVSAVAGVLTVAIVGITASRMYSRRVGLAAAALMAVTPFAVLYVHIASTDVLLSALVALGILCAHTATCSERIGPAAVAGAAAGLAFATKYTGLAMAVLAGWVVVERWLAERSLRRAGLRALAAAAGFLGAFAAGCPPCVLTPATMLEGMQRLFVSMTLLAPSYSNNFLTPTLGWHGKPFLFQLVASLPFTLGWPLYAAALAGVVLAVWRHERADRLLLVVTAVFFFSMGRSRVVFPRYLMPLFPGLVMLAARALLATRRPRWAGGALLAAIWLYSITLTVTQVARFSFDQQRGVAEWIATSRRPGQTNHVGFPAIALEYFRLTVPLRQRRLKPIELTEGHWFDEPLNFIVIPEWYEIAVARDRPNGQAARDLERLRSGEAGFRIGPRWRSTYLQRDFYTWLDPAYAADLWQGEIGFTVFVRDATTPPPARDGATRAGAR
jgi:4-amino-4-deoxy-L-arabinose transferase-like glycosyltransferase